ncbi:MAG: IS110 family transposase [Promethearchaeia archaeon]
MELIEFKFDLDWRSNPFFCGLDVHKHKLAVCICSAEYRDAKIVSRSIFQVNSRGLHRFWNYVKKYHPAGFAMEATGIYHHVIYKFLRKHINKVSWNSELVITNPADAKGLPGRPKNDKIDSKDLAIYLAKGLLKKGKPVIEVLEDIKAIFRRVSRLEKERTALKNRIKKTLDRAGIRPRKINFNLDWVCHFFYYFVDFEGPLGAYLDEIFSKDHPLYSRRNIIKKHIDRFEQFASFSLTNVQRALIRQDLVDLDFKTGRKLTFIVEIGQIIEQYPNLRRHAGNLASVPGISKTTAVWILAEIGSIKRYPTPRKFAAYCGCCPRIVSSAGKVYSAHITRHSNSYLRTIFFNAAVVVCNFTKQDSELKRYAVRALQRKGKRAYKLAVCNVATKMTKIVYAILRDGVPFETEPTKKRKVSSKKQSMNQFSLVDKRVIRQARKVLNRVNIAWDTEDFGLLKTDIDGITEKLDCVLKGKKIK